MYLRRSVNSGVAFLAKREESDKATSKKRRDLKPFRDDRKDEIAKVGAGGQTQLLRRWLSG